MIDLDLTRSALIVKAGNASAEDVLLLDLNEQLLQNQPKESTGVMGNLGDAARNAGEAVGDVGNAGNAFSRESGLYVL